jgi:branched-chain amino acid aminotransferase
MTVSAKPTTKGAAPGTGSPLVWIDGEWYDRARATISVYDHGLLDGDGVFEGTRVYGGKIFRLNEHLERLYDSAKAIWLTIPLDRDEMAALTEEAVRRSGIAEHEAARAHRQLVRDGGEGGDRLLPRQRPQ